MTEINRIRKLAGLPEIQENVEENDYGSELSSRKGEVYPGSTSRPGTARAPTVPVPAKSGDNPLAEMKSFKDYLKEVTSFGIKLGSIKPIKLSDLRGDDSQGWAVARYSMIDGGMDWVIPAWDEQGHPDLEGTFNSSEEAQAAIDAQSNHYEGVNSISEFTEHVYPKKGDLRPVLYSKYRGDEYSGWGVEQYNTTTYGGSWDMPDWFHDEPSLAGPFSSSRDARDAINAYLSNQENLDESKQSGKYRDTLCLSFGTDGEADYVELDVSFTYTVQWGSPEVGRSYMGDPAAYDPGSPSEIEDIAIVAIDGVDPMKYGADTIDVVLDELNSGKHDDALIANASDQEESRRPDESVDEATNWQTRERRFGEPMILLPTGHNVSLDAMDQTYFDEGSYVYVVGKGNSAGKFTPRLCISSGKLNYRNDQEVTIVHDQNRGLTPGRVLFQFSYDDWMNKRDVIAHALESIGVARNKKIPVKVFK